MIRCGLIHGQSEKGFKGDAVIDLAFQIRIGGDLKPFLKHQTLEQQKRRIGLTTFGMFSGMIELFKQLVDRVPVDGQVELFEHGQGAVFSGDHFDSKVGKGNVARGFL